MAQITVFMIIICDLIIVIMGFGYNFRINTGRSSYPTGYYDCVGYDWCCPAGYSCAGYPTCYKYYSNYSFYSYDDASSNIDVSNSSSTWTIVGASIGSVVAFVFLCSYLANYCKDHAKTGQVQSIDLTREHYENTHTGIRQQQIGIEHANMQPLSLPGSYESAYPSNSNHV